MYICFVVFDSYSNLTALSRFETLSWMKTNGIINVNSITMNKQTRGHDPKLASLITEWNSHNISADDMQHFSYIVTLTSQSTGWLLKIKT